MCHVGPRLQQLGPSAPQALWESVVFVNYNYFLQACYVVPFCQGGGDEAPSELDMAQEQEQAALSGESHGLALTGKWMHKN